ncbi:Uncharacterised protein [Mycobacteroides abscessus subsp. abscessus]|nr:Uncharacterised protein [Mycobacteroides abscessus subsp. abscessus]
MESFNRWIICFDSVIEQVEVFQGTAVKLSLDSNFTPRLKNELSTRFRSFSTCHRIEVDRERLSVWIFTESVAVHIFIAGFIQQALCLFWIIVISVDF